MGFTPFLATFSTALIKACRLLIRSVFSVSLPNFSYSRNSRRHKYKSPAHTWKWPWSGKHNGFINIHAVGVRDGFITVIHHRQPHIACHFPVIFSDGQRHTDHHRSVTLRLQRMNLINRLGKMLHEYTPCPGPA